MKILIATILLATASHNCNADYQYEISASTVSRERSISYGDFYFSNKDEKLQTSITAYSSPVALHNQPIPESGFLSKKSSFLIGNTIYKYEEKTNSDIYSTKPLPREYIDRKHASRLTLSYRGVFQDAVLLIDGNLNAAGISDTFAVGGGYYFLDSAAMTARFIRKTTNEVHETGLGVNYRHYFPTTSSVSYSFEADATSVGQTADIKSKGNLYIGQNSHFFITAAYRKVEAKEFTREQTYDNYSIGYQHHLGKIFAASIAYESGDFDSYRLKSEKGVLLGLKVYL